MNGPVTTRLPLLAVRPLDEQIVEAYRRLGSVWKAADELGMRGQTLHKRLRRSGCEESFVRVFTDEEKARIVEYYGNTSPDVFDLSALSAEMNRPRSSISMVAKDLGISRRGRSLNTAARARIGDACRLRIQKNGHPRGMSGKTHSAETKAEIGKSSSEKWAYDKAFGVGWMSPGAKAKRRVEMSERMIVRLGAGGQTHSRAMGGRADDLGETWFRSSWERNYARYLNTLVKLKIVEHWDYEKEAFWFEGVKRGAVSYRPDFRVKYKNRELLEYVEVKGWVTDKDKTKWKRMKKYHPEINLVVVGDKEYREIKNRWASSVLNWENGSRDKKSFVRAFGKQVPFEVAK